MNSLSKNDGQLFVPFFARGQRMVVGVDEVGRGCLAGPVSACAFAFNADGHAIDGLKDSKKLSPKKREKLVPMLEFAGLYGHGSATSEEVDDMGIVAANFLSMRRALCELMHEHGLIPAQLQVVVDGNQLPPFEDFAFGEFSCLIKADDLVPEVSAASILAKVKRDLWMRAQSVTYPGYGFESHAGYGSALHMQAIEDLGPCALHRMSFAPLNKINPFKTRIGSRP